MRRTAVLAVAFAALLATAGCQAPVSPDEPTTGTARQTDTTPTDSPTTTTSATTTPPDELVTVTDSLPYNVTKIYVRVGRMLDVPRGKWPEATVHVRQPPEGGGVGVASTSGFTHVMGIKPVPSAGEDGGVQTGAVTRGLTVTLFTHANVSNAWEKNVLAHEFVHVYQTQLPLYAGVRELDARRDRAFLYNVMVEGSAEYVQERYGIRYQGMTVNQTALTDGWRNASAYVRMRLAPYEYGSRYFALRVDDASGVASVYLNPPRTAEQVLHGLPPSGERAKPLTLTVNATGATASAYNEHTEGELFVRLALSTELPWARAADAAAGWGTDRVVRISASDYAGYAWALRWDSTAEASEFRRAFAEYAAARNRTFRVVSVTPGTLVVFTGTDGFLERASATGNASSVTVTV